MITRRNLYDVALGIVCLAAAWPLVEISHAHIVAVPIALGAVTPWIVGTLMRRMGRSSLAVVAAQALVALLVPLVVLVTHGVSPTPSSLYDAVRVGVKAADHSVVPLPALAGVIAVLAFGAALVALVVDFVGGASRMPAATVLPLAAPFVLATTALGETLPWGYFVAAALAWAFLLWADDASALRRASIPAFVALAATSVIGALLIAPRVPSRPTPALAQGGARGVDTTVDFSETLDLSKDLHSRNAAPVLAYTTEDPTPEPLRVTTSSSYADGQWRADTKPATSAAKANTALPALGFDESVPTETYKASVTLNGMRPPLVATPTVLRAANFGNDHPTFDIVKTSGVPRLRTPAPAYSVMFRTFTARSRPTSDDQVGVGESVTAADLDVTSLPSQAQQRVQALSLAAGTASASTRFDKAVALQTYLRTDPSFTYSLELAPVQKVGGEALDPLSNFLQTRRGYCTQFATAMVMAARTERIPARIAIGFLPGTKKGREYTVKAADAHAWAELYFPGMGWTRFDPTPGQRSGGAPVYASPRTPTASPSSAPTRSTSVAPRTRSAAPTTSTSTLTSTVRPTAPHPRSGHSVLGRVLWTLTAVALVAGLLSILPLIGWSRRNAPLRRARDDRELDEGHWHRMTWNLRDLGLVVARGRSPRETATRFAEANPDSSPQLREALERAAEAIETSRYGATGTRGVASATSRVTRTARSDASLRRRIVAWLFPRSGRRRLDA